MECELGTTWQNDSQGTQGNYFNRRVETYHQIEYLISQGTEESIAVRKLENELNIFPKKGKSEKIIWLDTTHS